MTLIYPLQEPQQGAEEYVVNVQGYLVEGRQVSQAQFGQIIPTGSLAYVPATVQFVSLHSNSSYIGRSGWHTAANGSGFKRRPSRVRFKVLHSA